MRSRTPVADLEMVRDALRSSVKTVTVEAAAGCGKTYEAVGLACAVAATLSPPESVLLLTHTHAAKDEFARRIATTKGAAKVHISTIDSFLVELCTPYTAPLALPTALRDSLLNRTTSLAQVAEKASELLKRSPIVAQLQGVRFPFIILDEHQDASKVQHEVITSIAQPGNIRVRFFGDPMQAIYDFDGVPAIDWEALCGGSDVHCALMTPWRWSSSPDLGRWIASARANLAALQALPDIPKNSKELRSIIVAGADDAGYSTFINKDMVHPLYSLPTTCSSAALTYVGQRAENLVTSAGSSFTLNEGADFRPARDTLRSLCFADGDAPGLARIVVKALAAASVGFITSKESQCIGAIQMQAMNIGRKKSLAQILTPLSMIYERPSVWVACKALQCILRDPPVWIKRYKYPTNLNALAAVGDGSGNPRDVLEAIIAQRSVNERGKIRSVGTIHKAKGLQYESVLLWNFSAKDFPLNASSAKILYVAISRPTRELTLVAPGNSVSPFAPAVA